MKAPIAFRSNPGRYEFLGTPSLVNAYAEQLGPDSKDVLAVVPAEGLVQFADTSAGPCRGLIYLDDLDKLYSFHPSTCYRISSAGTPTLIGTVPGVDQLQLSRNQNASPQVVVQSAAQVQFLESDALSISTDTDFPSSITTAEFVSGYHAYGKENTTWYISGINDAKTIDPLDFATFEQQAGKLIRIQEANGELIGMNSDWMEFWRDTGNADFPFEPIGFRSRGLLAKIGVVRCDNTLMFPSDDNAFYRINNYDPVQIGSNETSRLLESDASPSAIIGFGIDRGSHKFAYWTGSTWTRGYDAATQSWHSRESYGFTTWRAQHSVKAFNKTIVGDSQSGKLFYLDRDTYTEASGLMVWKVISPPLHVFPNGAILDAAHFDLATGYGLLSGQGSNPKIMLRTSVDGGNTFGNYRELSLATTGNKGARVTARQLGSFGPKGIVFELSISDPVVRALVGCDVEIRPLKR